MQYQYNRGWDVTAQNCAVILSHVYSPHEISEFLCHSLDKVIVALEKAKDEERQAMRIEKNLENTVHFPLDWRMAYPITQGARIIRSTVSYL
mgnify:FL=1